jgi:hypothetical protein
MGQRVGPQVGGITAIKVVTGQKLTPNSAGNRDPIVPNVCHGPYPC